MDIKEIINEYLQQLYAHKFDNLNGPIPLTDTIYQNSHMYTEIIQIGPFLFHKFNKYFITFQTKKKQTQIISLVNSTKFYKGKVIPVLYIAENRSRENTSNSFYLASISLLPKPDKDIPWKEYYRSIPLMDIYLKILNKISAI